MSRIIAAKYGGPCLKCGNQIKAGSFVNWDRGHGIWHLNQADNEKLKSSMLDSSQIENSYCSNIVQREEKVMGSDGNDNTINLSDLIKALQGMSESEAAREFEKETAVEVVKSPKKEKKQHHGANQYSKELTDKQISFCEFMALGSSRADAYTNSYDITNPAFSGNAARKLLENKKIRDKIAELSNDLGSRDTKDRAQDFFNAIKSEGAKGGWAFTLTESQEKFCQAIADGATLIKAFKKSGYYTINWSDKKIRREASILKRLPKIKLRIVDLVSGDPPDIKVSVAGENSHKTQRSPALAKKSVEIEAPDQQPAILEERPAANGKLVDDFMERIKAHSRLFYYAIVARGQKEVGMPGANLEKMEEAVRESIEALRKTLSEKLL